MTDRVRCVDIDTIRLTDAGAEAGAEAAVEMRAAAEVICPRRNPKKRPFSI